MLTNHREAKSVNFSTYPAALESSQNVLVAYFRVDSGPKQWPCFKGHDLRKFSQDEILGCAIVGITESGAA